MTIGPDLDGERLDQALALLRPESGANERRRLIAAGLVRLDGRVVRKGDRVRAGQVLRLDASEPEAEAAPPQELPAGVRVVFKTERFAAIRKPAGLHTADVPGSAADTLERYLPLLLWEGAVLLNRLDGPTSGLVLAGRNPNAAWDYGEMQDRGQVRKRYLAVVRGRLTSALDLTRALDTDNRRKTRVRTKDDPDPLRHTRVTPLAYDDVRDLTLIEAVIHKGRRHQIRAHLASAGHPIFGDALYGGPRDGGPRLYLHHAELTFPGFRAYDPPDWTLFQDHSKD